MQIRGVQPVCKLRCKVCKGTACSQDAACSGECCAPVAAPRPIARPDPFGPSVLLRLQMAHAAGALVCVDNSILTCIYQRPLDLGADIAMTSGESRMQCLGCLCVQRERQGNRERQWGRSLVPPSSNPNPIPPCAAHSHQVHWRPLRCDRRHPGRARQAAGGPPLLPAGDCFASFDRCMWLAGDLPACLPSCLVNESAC